jgi:hypothetical protein
MGGREESRVQKSKRTLESTMKLKHNRDGDLLLKTGALTNLPPVVDMEQLLDTKIPLIDTSSEQSRPVGTYSLRDLLTKMM